MLAFFAVVSIVLSTLFYIIKPGEKAMDLRKIQSIHVHTLKRYDNSSYPAKLTIDNKTGYNNKFSPHPYSDYNYPIPVFYDLKFIYSIDEIHIYNDGPNNSIKQFRLLFSTDNEQYHHLYTSENLKDLNYNIKVNFATIRTRYIKLEILEAYGGRPEFREISFFSSKPIILKKSKLMTQKQQMDFADSVRIMEINPDVYNIPKIGIKEQKDNKYFYDESSIKLAMTNEGHHFLQLSFLEREKINREMHVFIPEINFSTNIHVNGGEYLLYYIDLASRGLLEKQKYTFFLENVAGPNAFLNSLSIYQKVKKVRDVRLIPLNAYRIQEKVSFNNMLVNRQVINIRNSIRKHYMAIFYNNNSTFIDLKIPLNLVAEPSEASLDLMVSFEHTTMSNYNDNIFHFNIPLIEREDQTPVVDLVPHIGQSFYSWKDILNDNYYSNFQGYIKITNEIHLSLKIPFSKVAKENRQLSINYIISSSNLDAPYYLSAVSTSPEYFNPVSLKPMIKKAIICRNSYYLNEKINIKVNDLLLNKNFKGKESTDILINNRQKLKLTETDDNSGIFAGSYTIPISYKSNFLKLTYDKLVKKISIRRGSDGQIHILDPKSQKALTGSVFKEKNKLGLLIKDKDLNKNNKKKESIKVDMVYDYINPITKSKEKVRANINLEEDAVNSENFRAELTIPNIDSLNKNIDEYTVTIFYNDNINSNGIVKKIRTKVFRVTRDIPIHSINDEPFEFYKDKTESVSFQYNASDVIITIQCQRIKGIQELERFDNHHSYLFYLGLPGGVAQDFYPDETFVRKNLLFVPNSVKYQYAITNKKVVTRDIRVIRTNVVNTNIILQQQLVRPITNMSMMTQYSVVSNEEGIITNRHISVTTNIKYFITNTVMTIPSTKIQIQTNIKKVYITNMVVSYKTEYRDFWGGWKKYAGAVENKKYFKIERKIQKDTATYILTVSNQYLNRLKKNSYLYFNCVRYYPGNKRKILIQTKEKSLFRSVLFKLR